MEKNADNQKIEDNNIEAINIFDFDGTLTTETWPKFWVWVKKFGYDGSARNDHLEQAIAKYRSTNSGNSLETFFGFFNDLLVDNYETISYKELLEGEKYIKYNPGMIDFLAKASVKNYIVSGGLKEFLQNLNINNYFEGIYGSTVHHNEEGLIVGIDEVMTDDKKILAICDILKKNGRSKNDCRNVYFIGDGCSDEPAMRFIHENGGKAIFVHQPFNDDDLYDYSNKIYEILNADGIIDFCSVADFRDDSILSKVLRREKLLIDSNINFTK